MLFGTHRLDRVLHFDKLLVLAGDRVVECGVAAALVQNPDGHFFKLLETTLLTF